MDKVRLAILREAKSSFDRDGFLPPGMLGCSQSGPPIAIVGSQLGTPSGIDRAAASLVMNGANFIAFIAQGVFNEQEGFLAVFETEGDREVVFASTKNGKMGAWIPVDEGEYRGPRLWSDVARVTKEWRLN